MSKLARMKRALSFGLLGFAALGISSPSHAAKKKKVAMEHAVATFPGFEMLGDGGSRVFVEVTKEIPVVEKKTKEGLEYTLKNVSLKSLNNTNPLVTVHFNTPVERAVLRRHGGNLVFKVKLRAGANPVWRFASAKDGSGTTLQIDFPSGDYLPKGSTPSLPATSETAPAAPPPPAESVKPADPPPMEPVAPSSNEPKP